MGKESGKVEMVDWSNSNWRLKSQERAYRGSPEGGVLEVGEGVAKRSKESLAEK